ncbi:MAG: Fpg/Nei family DNA glycosylase [Acidimicrobiales bacterium]
MPELPEVEILCRRLEEHAGGCVVEKLQLGSISALKTFDPPLSSFEGRAVGNVRRRGKYICIQIGEDFLVLNLARSGWVKWRDQLTSTVPKPGRGPLALRVRLEGGAGFDVTEMSTERRLAIWAVHSPDVIEAVATLGPEPTAAEFTRERLGELLGGQKGNLKHALSHQSLIAGVGNAYSDEALHAAKLSPYKPAAKLSGEELDRLYDGLTQVLSEAITRASVLDMDELKDGKRTGMRVHGRTGEACPICGATVREVSFSTRSLQYCPTCQTGGKPLADRRLSRLLK